MYTNRTRLTGLSGIDTDSMVKQLMKAESLKYDRLKKQSTTLKWQQEKYRDVASALKGFQDTFLDILSSSSIRASGSFGSYGATVKLAGADSSKISAKTTGKSVEGSYKFSVTQLARKSSVTSSSAASFSDKLASSEGVDLSSLAVGDTIKFSLDGVTKTIELTDKYFTADGSGGKTLNDAQFAANLKEDLNTAYGKTDVNGFSVSYDLNNATNKYKLTIEMQEKGHDLKIYEGTRSSDLTSKTGTTLISDETKLSAGKYSFKVTIGSDEKTISIDLSEASDAATVVKAINEALKNKEVSGLSAFADKDGRIGFSSGNATNNITISTGGGDGSADLLSKIGFNATTLRNTSVLSGLKYSNGAGTLSPTSKSLGELFGTSLTYDANGNHTFRINDVDITVNASESLDGLMNKINASAAGVTVKYDGFTGKFTMEAKNEGALNGFTGTSIDSKLSELLGFNFSTANYTAAQDAVFKINGVDTTRASNTFTVDGTEITLNEVTTGTEEITVDIKKDNSKTLETIKKFVTAYNELIAKINGEVDAKRAKNGKYSYYEPLTDDERNAMSESEVKLWEEKAKQGILGRDSILSGITRDMRSAMYQKFEIGDSKSLSLYDIGITTTSNYWEGGKLSIDEEKLAQMLNEHGEDISKMFTSGLGNKLNDIVNSTIGSKGSITEKAGVEWRAMSLTTNDMYKQLKKQEDKISDMLNYLIEKEDYYYSMFSKMESAIMQSNSQMEYLAAQLGS